MTAGDMTRICGWIGIYGRLIPVVVRVRCPGRLSWSKMILFNKPGEQQTTQKKNLL